MRYIGLSLVIAALFSVTACSSKSSSNSSDQSNATATSAADSNAAATTAAAPATAAAGDIPSYPGATTAASGSSNNMGESASGSVMMTPDSFDKVYAWYQQHMPAGSEKTHTTSPVETAVFVIGDPSSGQKSATITTQGSQTMITIANVKQ
jgi:hypothetical protein